MFKLETKVYHEKTGQCVLQEDKSSDLCWCVDIVFQNRTKMFESEKGSAILTPRPPPPPPPLLFCSLLYFLL